MSEIDNGRRVGKFNVPEGKPEPTEYLNLHTLHLFHHLLALGSLRYSEQLQFRKLVHAVQPAGLCATRTGFGAERTPEADNFEREVF